MENDKMLKSNQLISLALIGIAIVLLGFYLISYVKYEQVAVGTGPPILTPTTPYTLVGYISIGIGAVMMVVSGFIFRLRQIQTRGKEIGTRGPKAKNPLGILKMKLAKGEISESEFKRKRKLLEEE